MITQPLTVDLNLSSSTP